MSTKALRVHRVLHPHAKAVKSDLRSIDTAVKGAASMALGASGPPVLALQHALRHLGLYAGKMSGELDLATQVAVKKLQAAKQLPVTGIVDGREAALIRSREKFVKDGFKDSAARLGQSGGDIKSVEQKLKALGFEPGKVDGVFDRKTLAAVRKFRRAAGDVPNKGDGIGPRLLRGAQKRIAATERDLKVLGYQHLGKANGHLGPKTAKALRAFQRKHHLPVTGEANWRTRSLLDRSAARMGRYPHVSPRKFQKGYDVSARQSTAQVKSLLAQRSTKFLGMKATEGTGYTNPNFKKWWSMAGKKLKPGRLDLRVAYHFLQPGNGRAQADKFLRTVGVHGKLRPGTRLALDWEGPALGSTRSLVDAARRIKQVTGRWPLIYTSASQAGRAKAVLPKAPMWVAHYPPSRSDYQNPFVQTSGSGVDRDVFTGTERALRRWAGWPS